MQLIVQSFTSLDGVIQSPGAVDEDTEGGFDLGGWQMRFGDAETGKAIVQRYESATALLLGRRTYDIWAPYWPHAPDGSEPFRSLINGMPKYVASRRSTDFGWNNSHGLGPDAAAVRKLKQQPGGTVLVPGSANLLQTLLRESLVDELELIAYPLVLGKGRRLFEAGLEPSTWHRVGCSPKPGGAVVSVYRFAGPLQPGSD